MKDVAEVFLAWLGHDGDTPTKMGSLREGDFRRKRICF